MKKLLAWTCLAAAALLSGCGGGLYLSYEGDWDERPSVNLVSASTSAAPGQTVRLAAAASDDGWIRDVRFYRVDSGGQHLLLGVDDRDPYGWDARIPDNAAIGSTVRFFARAEDDRGNTTDSDLIGIAVR